MNAISGVPIVIDRVAVRIEQFDGHIIYAAFSGILIAIMVCVVPDVVRDDCLIGNRYIFIIFGVGRRAGFAIIRRTGIVGGVFVIVYGAGFHGGGTSSVIVGTFFCTRKLEGDNNGRFVLRTKHIAGTRQQCR